MADVISQYNQTYKLWTNGEVTKTTIKAMLLDATGTFSAAHTTIDQVAGAPSGGHRPKEVYGNGWTEGGELLTSVVVSIWNSNGFMIDAADTRKTAVGGSIGPYDNVVLYDATSGAVLWHIQNESTKTAGAATDNVIVYNAGGIFRGSLT